MVCITVNSVGVYMTCAYQIKASLCFLTTCSVLVHYVEFCMNETAGNKVQTTLHKIDLSLSNLWEFDLNMVKHIFHFSLWNQKLVMCENSWTLSGTSGVCTADRATCDLLVISFSVAKLLIVSVDRFRIGQQTGAAV